MTNRTFNKLKKYEIYLHVFFWGINLAYPFLRTVGRETSYEMSLLHELNILVFNMIPVYVMYLWFFPLKVKSAKKYALAILVVLINPIIAYQFDSIFHPGSHYTLWIESSSKLIIQVSLILVFFAWYSIKSLYEKQEELDAITREKQQAEMRSLKAQLNPHFLFNTLNTIYASALKKEDKAPDLILKLSDSFRYFMSDGQKESVSLKKEIQHLRDYINLQQERLSDKIVVHWAENIDDMEQKIPPLLLISLIENAFKYTSILKGQNHLIKITTSLIGKVFTFKCENPYNEKAISQIDENWRKSGVGIENTRKRLELLYPEKHQFMINSDDSVFKVSLNLYL